MTNLISSLYKTNTWISIPLEIQTDSFGDHIMVQNVIKVRRVNRELKSFWCALVGVRNSNILL